jgi:uncharacterized membrane protein YkoI
MMRRFVPPVAALFVFVACARADDEEKVPLDKVPKAVMDAAKKKFPKAEVVSASKDKENGKTVYELELKAGGKKIEATFTADGAVTSIEQQIDAKDLPKAVSDTLGKKYPKAQYKTVEDVTRVKDGKEVKYYEVVLVTADKKEMEIEIFADGKIKEEEEKKK